MIVSTDPPPFDNYNALRTWATATGRCPACGELSWEGFLCKEHVDVWRNSPGNTTDDIESYLRLVQEVQESIRHSHICAGCEGECSVDDYLCGGCREDR